MNKVIAYWPERSGQDPKLGITLSSDHFSPVSSLTLQGQQEGSAPPERIQQSPSMCTQNSVCVCGGVDVHMRTNKRFWGRGQIITAP